MEEIHDVCVLLSQMMAEIVNHEEALRFTLVPEEGEDLRQLLVDALGRNLLGLAEVTAVLDEAVSMIGTDHGGTKKEPRIVQWIVKFELPEDFVETYQAAFRRYEHAIGLEY